MGIRSVKGLERVVTRIAWVVSFFVFMIIPIGYGWVVYDDVSEAISFKAKVKASALSGLVASAPDTWMYAENRIQGIIAREPIHLAGELVKVLDSTDSEIARAGTMPSRLTMEKGYPIFDTGSEVGKLVIVGSLEPLLQPIAISMLLSALLAAVVFSVMKVLPLRALKKVSDALFREVERAETTLESISDAVVTTDEKGIINYMNPSAEKLLGRQKSGTQGLHVSSVVFLRKEDVGEPIECSLSRALNTNSIVSCQGNGEILCSDGRLIAVEERSAPINDRHGRVSGGVLVLRDVSVTREYVRRRSWEATHDPLTGLSNRREFEYRVQLALDDSKASGRSYALCFMDLDRFKVVNDTSGHAAGDELLIQITRLMQARVRDVDILARLGGDEFGLLLEGCDAKQGKVIATEIMAAVNDLHFTWESTIHTVGVSVGVTAISCDHCSVSEVVSEADYACYWAKEQGKNQALIFVASDMDLAARRSDTAWVLRINEAFKEKRFVLYQQTYKTMDCSADHTEHLEILIRMVSETGEVIAPLRFLPAAERYNLMEDIDRWVICEVFSRYEELVAQRGGKPVICAINLSAASISSDDFSDFVGSQAQKFHMRPGAICFELTESVAVQNIQATADFISKLKMLGFLFALDDVGRASGSFSYLKKMSVDYLKIDGGFVKNMEHDSIDQTMVEAINQIAHRLGKLTVAEDSESDAIVLKLGTIGVDFAQGYSVCTPKPLFDLNTEECSSTPL